MKAYHFKSVILAIPVLVMGMTLASVNVSYGISTGDTYNPYNNSWTTGSSVGGINTGDGTTIGGANIPSSATLQNPLKAKSLGGLINSFVDVFTYVAVIAAVVAFIIVGLKYIMARGKPDKITEANRWLWYVIIGTAIIIGARLIIEVVLSTLVASGVVKPEIVNSVQTGLGK